MRKHKRVQKLAWLLLIAIIFTLPAFATSSEGDPSSSSEPEIPFIMFTNEPITNPDLYVKKVVTTSSSLTKIPEATFTFTVKVNGELYANQKYRVLDSNGKELFLYATTDGNGVADGGVEERLPNEDGTGAKVDYKTDRNGDFTLKAGQTAWFEFVGNEAKCEVTEKTPQITDGSAGTFTQIQPVGQSPWYGTVDKDGVTAEFINRYDPPEEPGQSYTDVLIEKVVSFPKSYEYPAFSEFKFQMFVADDHGIEQKWFEEPYLLNGEEELYTDEDGCFTLKAGDTALFEDVPTDRDYRIVEIIDGTPAEAQGWRVVGPDTQEGATAGNMAPITFTNALASFAIGKRLSDYNVGTADEFHFTLTKTEGSSETPLQAKYYLYDNNRQLVLDDLQETGADGTFTLKAGQLAVFVGIEPGTVINVEEAPTEGYDFETPASGKFTNLTVPDSFVEEHWFVNELNSTSLTVQKTVHDPEGMPPHTKSDEVLFSFVLKQKAEGSDEYVVLPNATYTIGENRDKTTEAGVFKLKEDEIAIFPSLKKTLYKIEEIDIPTGFQVSSDGKDGWSVDLRNKEGSLLCVNDVSSGSDLTISKILAGSSAEDDKDWTFTIDFYSSIAPDEVHADTLNIGPFTSTLNKTEVSVVNGKAIFKLKGGDSVTIEGIPTGYTWKLSEAEANQDGYETKWSMTEGKEGEDMEENTDHNPTQTTTEAQVNYSVVCTNTRGRPLAATGGPGLVRMIVVGCICVVAAVGIVIWTRKRDSRDADEDDDE